ncbi:ImmA/IrrE family metallo-endopeptidase [Paracoccus aestuariivivens]|nr:ImmA/IrrE family metallo-endopeptidase [Paracoccus aestuariivivens]
MAAINNIIHISQAARGKHPGRLLIPARLTEARTAKKMTQSQLAAQIEVSRQSVSTYELGTKNPDPEVMVRIARVLQQPMTYFTREEIPSFGNRSTVFFRKTGADTKKRNQACAVHADWLVSAAATLANYAHLPQVDLPSFEPSGVGVCYTDDEIEESAESVRKHFNLNHGPISNVVRLLEAKGVIVCRQKMEGENVGAFSFWSGDRPFIYLASDRKSAARARFDAAHELGHLCLHRWIGEDEVDDADRLKEIEQEADRFAGAFLLPRKSFPNEVFSSRAEGFIELKSRWKVSIQAMAYRCKDLGVFDDRQITNIYKQISYKKWRTTEPLDGENGLPFEEPVVLRKLTDLLLDSGKVSAADVALEIGPSPDILSQILGTDRLRMGVESRADAPDLSLK